MTLQALLQSGPFLIDLTIIAAYIIGSSAATFGLYDIHHKHWKRDLPTMTTTLLISAGILALCNLLKNGSPISNAMLFTYTYLIAATYFITNYYKNHKLTNEKQQQTNYLKKLLNKK